MEFVLLVNNWQCGDMQRERGRETVTGEDRVTERRKEIQIYVCIYTGRTGKE